eukprot:403355749
MAKKCKQCKKYFNLTNRRPIVISECSCTHCLECILTLLNGNQQRQILCPGCDEIRTLPEELKESLHIIKDIKKQDLLTIICDEHQSKITNLFCLECDIPVCIECKLDNHKDHKMIDFRQYRFKNYSENVKSLLDEYSLENMKFKIDKYAKNEIQITSSQFNAMISKITRMLSLFTDDEEKNKIDLVSYLEEPQNDIQSEKINPKVCVPIISPGKDLIGFSKIDIQNLINESQAVLREEFKQVLETFETTQIKKEKTFADKTNLRINDIQKRITLKLEQLKRRIDSDLQVKLKEEVEKDIDIKAQLQIMDYKLISLDDQIKDIYGNFQNYYYLNEKTQELDTEISFFKQHTLDQLDLQKRKLMEFKKILNSHIINNDIDELQQMKDQKVISEIKPSLDFEQLLHNIHEKSKEEKISAFNQLVYQEIYKTEFGLLKHLLIKDGVDKKFHLLFKGSNHGFNDSKFHKLCDNQGPTIIFIMSELGQVFGAYTSIPWANPEQHQTYSDPSAFLFSLSKRSIHRQYQNFDGAVYHTKHYIFKFGFNCDIAIADNCNYNSNSICHLGGTYELPDNANMQNLNERRSYLSGGQSRFKVMEIEVYKVY